MKVWWPKVQIYKEKVINLFGNDDWAEFDRGPRSDERRGEGVRFRGQRQRGIELDPFSSAKAGWQSSPGAEEARSTEVREARHVRNAGSQGDDREGVLVSVPGHQD